MRAFISVCFMLLLAPLVKVRGEQDDPADLQMLKQYFSSQDGRLDEHHDELRNFVVTPDNPKISEFTDYTIEFTVGKKTFQKMYYGYLVFYFPDGFGFSDLDSARIDITNYDGVGFKVNDISSSGRFLYIYYRTVFIDGSGKASLIPDSMNFEIFLHEVRNPSKAGKYKIAGAGIKDHKFVAGPSWSEKFEITESYEIEKPELQIVSTFIVAPNAPYVNTYQEFDVHGKVKNVGTIAAHGNIFEIRSDGNSSLGLPFAAGTLFPGDSVFARFHIVAALEPSDGETFHIVIDTTKVIEVPAIDNEATAIIQTPALLEIESNIEDSSVVNIGSNETLDVYFNLLNHGQAGAGSGRYTLTAIGTEINGDTTKLTGAMAVGTPVEFEYESTNSGRVVLVKFNLDTIPTDLNSRQSAQIIDSNINFTIIEGPVHPSEPEDSIAVEDNPFDPGDGPVDIQYTLPRDMDIDFNIYTIIGEEVLNVKFKRGTNGGQAGVNTIQWDGRNDRGLIVLNGVYIVIISNHIQDFELKLKLAVLK